MNSAETLGGLPPLPEHCVLLYWGNQGHSGAQGLALNFWNIQRTEMVTTVNSCCWQQALRLGVILIILKGIHICLLAWFDWGVLWYHEWNPGSHQVRSGLQPFPTSPSVRVLQDCSQGKSPNSRGVAPTPAESQVGAGAGSMRKDGLVHSGLQLQGLCFLWKEASSESYIWGSACLIAKPVPSLVQ